MAAVDYFLKLDGIKGESADSKHKDEVDVESWNWSETNAGSSVGGGRGAGKVSMQDFSFSMKVNKASPKLFAYCANGQPIASALLTCRRAGKDQQEYLKITFTDVLVSSYSTGGSAADVVPLEQITLCFNKIEISYAPQKNDGTLDSPIVQSWDKVAAKLA
jgi:type VI secretion system secreted protein Hcp